MAMLDLDAVTYPTSNIPRREARRADEPTVNERSSNAWTLLGANGFPAITVPAGFTTRGLRSRSALRGRRKRRSSSGRSTARLPVGVDFLARPFDEPTLFRIAAAYEAATRHRVPPPGLRGPLPDSGASETQ